MEVGVFGRVREKPNKSDGRVFNIPRTQKIAVRILRAEKRFKGLKLGGDKSVKMVDFHEPCRMFNSFILFF